MSDDHPPSPGSDTPEPGPLDPRSDQAILTAMLEATAEEVWFCDREMNLSYANLTGVRALGFDRAEDVFQPMPEWLASLEIFHEDGTPRAEQDAPLLRSLRGEEIRGEIERVRHPVGGRILWREVDSRPVRSADGEIVGAVAVVRDVSERLREQQELKRHDARMAAIAAASHAFAEAGLDFQTIMDRVTHAVAEEVGDFCSVRLLDEETGELALVSLHHPDPDAVALVRELGERHRPAPGDGLFGDVLETGEPLNIPSADPEAVRARVPAVFASYHDRRPIHALMIVPMRAHDRVVGTMTAWRERDYPPYGPHDLVLLQDLADQAALAVENARLYEASQSAVDAKSNFLAIISHELRTPLNVVLGHADLLQMGVGGEMSERQAESVERIKLSVDHLRRIVDELIDYAQLEAGQQKLEPRELALRDVVDDAVAMVEEDVERKGLDLDVDVPGSLRLEADPQKLRQVLLNLLTNAVRFTDEGGIRVHAEADDDGVRVAVSDSGVGIAKEHLQQIFEPFWQVEAANTRRYGGTGLGLSLSRRMARAMGGDVEVRSELGSGSTFVLWLPDRHGPEPDPVDP